jgi:VCBS repeat-containing protein
VAESVGVSDGLGTLPSELMDVPENVVVADTTTLDFLPVVEINVTESVAVGDSVGPQPSAWVGIPEEVVVSDAVDLYVSPVVEINVTESVAVGDSVGPQPSAWLDIPEVVMVGETVNVDVYPIVELNISETVGVNDSIGTLPSAWLEVGESVAVTDTIDLYIPPVVQINVAEMVTVADNIQTLPSVMINVSESVGVIDSIDALPSAWIDVSETVSVSDIVDLYIPPVVEINVSESINVTDTVDMITSVIIHVHESIVVKDTIGILQVDSGADQQVDEGQILNFTGSVTEPAEGETFTVEWDFGDGTSDTDTLTPTHVYADNGLYSIIMVVTYDNGASVSNSIDVTVENVAPTVNAGSDLTVDEGFPVNIAEVTFNDPGTLDTHTATIDWGDETVEPGSVTENPFGPPGSTAGADGTVSGSHAYDDNGTFTVTVCVTDDDGISTCDTLIVNVTNVAPTADAGGPYTGSEGSAITLDGSGSSDQGSDILSFAWDLDNDGQYDDATGVTPAFTFLVDGVFTIGLQVTDDDGGVGTATATVTVSNVAPFATDQTVTTNEDTPVGVTLTASDPGSDSLTYSVVSGPTSGTLSGAAQNRIYIPNLNFNGSDSFTFKANDGSLDSNVATVNITVNSVNDEPVANAGPYQTVEATSANGATVTLDGSGSYDEDGDALTYLWTGPFGTASGVLVSVTVPLGTNTITLTVTDPQGEDALDTVVVQVVDTTPPSLTVPADIIAEALDETGTVVVYTSTADDLVDGAVTPACSPESGLVFDVGATPVTCNASDSRGNLSTASFNVIVTTNPDRSVGEEIPHDTGGTITTPDGSVNIDIPAGALDSDTYISIAETGTSYELTSNLGNAFAVYGVIIQPDGTTFNIPITITFTWDDADNNGWVDGTNIREDNMIITKDNVAVTNRCRQEPGPVEITGAECNSTDNYFKFQVSSLSKFALVFVDDQAPVVSDVIANPNPAPINTDIVLSAIVDDTLAGLSPIGSAEYSVDGGAYLPMEAEDGAYDDPVESVIVIIPSFVEAGVHNVCVRGYDTLANALSADECILVKVNNPPVAVNDTATTDEDTPVTINVLANDSDVNGDPLTAMLDTAPANGTLTLNADGSFEYVPDENWYGTDSFTYKANDGELESEVATVTITVSSVNDAPDAVDDSYSIDEDDTLTEVVPGVLSNDSDIEGDTLTVDVENTTGPDHGQLSLTSDGAFSYSPDPDYYGEDSFVYEICDSGGLCDTAAVTITVTPVNDAPVVTLSAESELVQCSDGISPVTITATDIDSPALSISAVLPADIGIGSEDCNNSGEVLTCTWIIEGQASVSAGIYDVTVTVSDWELEGTADMSFNVVHEDTVETFDADNPVAVEVATAGGDSGTFDLVVYVREMLPDIADGTAYPGYIDRAEVSMTLQPVGPGSSVLGACTPGTVTGIAYDAVKTVICSFDEVPVNTYTAEVIVNGDYYAGYNEDVLVVYDPSLGFTTGGGWFYWPGTDHRTNFGYTMKYNKKGKKVQGNLLLISHLPDGTKYRVKSNSLYGLSLGETPINGEICGWASFSGKSTYLEPGMPEPEGNHEFVAYVEDCNEPGTGVDSFWIEVHDKDGDVINALSMLRDAYDNAETLNGGNIVVPHRAQ